MARNVDSHDESSKPVSVPRGSAHGKWVAHKLHLPKALKGQGLGTIIQMTIFICVPHWGNWVVYTAWG